MTDEIKVPKGLANVVVDSTSIATTGASGNLLYRGYRAVDLADRKSFEEVAYLIVYGKLPANEELKSFRNKLDSEMKLDEKTKSIMDILKEKDIMRNLRSIVSLIHYSKGDTNETFIQMEAKLPLISAYSAHAAYGRPMKEMEGEFFVEKFFSLIADPSKKAYWKSLEKLMILYMEHEFNASTFALRVAASTLTDPVSAVTAALATLKGPLHGGANSEVLSYLSKIKNEQDARDFVEGKLANKEKIMGFGHRVYKKKDPRAQYVKEELRRIAPDYARFKAAEYVENYMFEKKGIPANVDLFAAVLMDFLGIEEIFNLPVFACSRIFGWNAHYNEQVADNKLIRPAAEYTGPEERDL
ncbi:citrate/2-methylcitrate synthase [Cuniculiplasma sp. SKW3]|uniref:citrate/2-methylcitrate synthase n=1 Tax=Cuniculiplasma sp. SKW3 TaxID=3400170 RepID=UPI003FD19636